MKYFTEKEMQEIQDTREIINYGSWEDILGLVHQDKSLIQKATVMATEFHDDLRRGLEIFLAPTSQIQKAHWELRSGSPQLLRVTGNLVSSEIGDGSYEYAIDIDRARRAISGSSEPEDVRHLRLLGNLFPSI